ncbi:MAG: DsbA family protein [Nitrospira sp.]|nr:DsbA family protein [Nitrospira sp.]MDH5193669.1 DsbA family protein [Nitrospira sp.]
MLVLAHTVLLFGTAGLAETGSHDPGVLRQELDAVKTDLETIKKQLSEIQKQFAQRQAPPPPGPVTMSVGDGPVLGQIDAPITIVEFSDYQCPFCKRHFTNTLGMLKTNYIDTGKVRYIFRDFPLDSIHPYARKAAEAAHCAGDQGKFWDMHDTMFQRQEELKPHNLRDFARAMQLDLDAFNACLDEGKYAKRVEADVAAGSAAGVTGTPGFFVGKTKPDGTMVATFVKGAQPASAFSQVIERLLEEKMP